MNDTEGKGGYAQVGYYFTDWKVQPWMAYERWNATDSFGRWYAYRLGLSYFFKGHDANIKLGYERVNTEKDIGSSPSSNSAKDSINTFMLGFYLRF